MTEAQNFITAYVPTRTERFWNATGFRCKTPETPDGTEEMSGWMATNAHVRIGVLDRIRLLISGRALLRIHIWTDSEVKNAVSASSFEVKPPFGWER